MARAPGRWAIVGLAISEGRRATLAALRRLPAALTPSRDPEQLLFAPRDLRTADPAVADDMLEGLYVFGDTEIERPGVSPFGIEPPNRDWAEDLLGFGWLRHLRAAETPAADELARALVASALGLGRGLAQEAGGMPAVAARRVLAFLAQSPMLLPGADAVFFRRFLRRLGRDVALLERAMRDAPVAEVRLAAAIAVCMAGLCCGGFERRSRRGTRVLSAELDAQILPDGGHVGRNPGQLLDLLLDLLPLRLLYASRGLEVPPALDLAIDRMMPMLRFFRLGSGDLALFNGMGRTPIGDLATVMTHDTAQDRPSRRAVPSGYDRIEAGDTVAIVDDGAIPPAGASAGAHAGCLAFEMSSGRDLLIVNGGASARSGSDREAARRTAAHSTLVIGDHSSAVALDAATVLRIGWPAPFAARRLGPALVAGPSDVASERGRDGARNIVLSARHDGYLSEFGAVHERRLRLSEDGTRLDGEDTLTVSAGLSARGLGAVLRFHLHPAVRPASDPDGTVRLDLPAGRRWRFVPTGGRARLEASVVFAVAEGRRPTRQIVLPLPDHGDARRVAVAWSLVMEPEPD